MDMEHREQERDSISLPRFNQEPSVDLRLLPTPLDRSRNAVVPTHHRFSILSPRQTLDQLMMRSDNQDLDPTAEKTGGGPSSSETPALPHPTHKTSPSPPAEASTTSDTTSAVTYKECLRNHAAITGSHALDGCREFMPGRESLACAACDCHRNFHRKVISGHPEPSLSCNAKEDLTRVTVHFPSMVGPMQPAITLNFGGVVAAESPGEYYGENASKQISSSGQKKRLRTKFSHEQKEKMHEFANKVGWRIGDEDDEQVNKFCTEVGVKRGVFKVWMHNHKKRQM